jgi:hypothetical protein
MLLSGRVINQPPHLGAASRMFFQLGIPGSATIRIQFLRLDQYGEMTTALPKEPKPISARSPMLHDPVELVTGNLSATQVFGDQQRDVGERLFAHP